MLQIPWRDVESNQCVMQLFDLHIADQTLEPAQRVAGLARMSGALDPGIGTGVVNKAHRAPERLIGVYVVVNTVFRAEHARNFPASIPAMAAAIALRGKTSVHVLAQC